MTSLEDLGFSEDRRSAMADAEARIGRVTIAHRGIAHVLTADGEVSAEMGGHLRVTGAVVSGDWVAIEGAPPSVRVSQVLPRRTAISRKVKGAAAVEQVLAANVDVVLLVCGMDGDYNPRRIERALVATWDVGAQPMVVLTKADLCTNEVIDARKAEVAAIAASIPVLSVSARRGDGMDAVRAAVGPGKTAVLLGSSGAGKSTLVNALLGAERQDTGEVRESDSRGRHTTTQRELLLLPGGGLVIDTPGLRELQLWDGAGLERVFDEMARLADACRFGNCRHESEPGCAVLAAVAAGTLEESRLASYRKLQAEVAHVEVLRDARSVMDEKRKWRTIHKAARNHRPRE